jgi:Zn-dependent protease with chaperone function
VRRSRPSVEEVAAITAHELGHLLLRHRLQRRAATRLGTFAPLALVRATGSR